MLDLEHENPASHIYFSQRLRLHFLDWGNPTAPHVLLVHGIHDQCHAWDWTARYLSSRFHVVAPDLRGHGDSEWSKGGNYSLMDHVYDLAQLVHQQNLDPVTVISHSLGGTIASLFTGSYPKLVDRLVIVEGVGLYPRFGNRAPDVRIKEWVRTNLSLAGRVPRRYGSLEEAANRMREQNPHLDEEQARHLTIHGTHQNEDGTYMWKFDNYTRLSSPYDITQEDMRSIWECISCPVLIINSERGYPHRIGQDDTLQHFKNVET
ncbi:MAG: alpha/beta hydrolase, partial [Gammaproteobacteria bacterium]|nr:alpha/beta hydrolase [Gammaproteobacteria bacterium]